MQGKINQAGYPNKTLSNSFSIFLLPDPIQNIIHQPEGNILPRLELPLPLPEEKLFLDSFIFDLVLNEGHLFGGLQTGWLGYYSWSLAALSPLQSFPGNHQSSVPGGLQGPG
jgi:hypothetical protein